MIEGAPHLVQASDMMAMRQFSSTMLIVKTKRHLQNPEVSGEGADHTGQRCWEDADTFFAVCNTKVTSAREVNAKCRVSIKAHRHCLSSAAGRQSRARPSEQGRTQVAPC